MMIMINSDTNNDSTTTITTTTTTTTTNDNNKHNKRNSDTNSDNSDSDSYSRVCGGFLKMLYIYIYIYTYIYIYIYRVQPFRILGLEPLRRRPPLGGGQEQYGQLGNMYIYIYIV